MCWQINLASITTVYIIWYGRSMMIYCILVLGVLDERVRGLVG